LPKFKKMVLNMRATTVVKKILVAVYEGFLQYDLFCFHRQAMHCAWKDCEYWVGKYESFDLRGGLLSSLTKALFLLQQCDVISILRFSIRENDLSKKHKSECG